MASCPAGVGPRAGDAGLTEGERWTRDELAALLASRFSPAAIARFLLHSQRRAGRIRRQRPAVAARMRWWIAVGALAWGALAAARVEPFRRRLRAGLAWWAATAIMLDWHIGMLETEDGVARNLGSADALTLLRCWLVPVAADGPRPALIVLGGATDVLDGIAARATVPTRAGRDLEGLVDVCFAVAALRGAVRRGQLGPAVAGVELTRLGAGFAYALVVYFGAGQRPDPTVLRAARLATPVRLGGVIAAACGRRRLGEAALLTGSLGSLLTLARALRRR